jgi:uncharacterized membrane protein
MLGLTTLGLFHTAISLVALAAGAVALVRDKEIVRVSALGQLYIWTTVITSVTGFGIFQHGGFGKPHALGVLTLIVLAFAAIAGRTQWFGRASRYIETIGYTLTFLFHMIPALTETFTRIPLGSPLFSSPEDPVLAKITGLFFLAFLVGATLQVRRLRSSAPRQSGIKLA